jgi:hypothetical protein
MRQRDRTFDSAQDRDRDRDQDRVHAPDEAGNQSVPRAAQAGRV